MKKLIALIFVLLATFLIAGCTFDFTTSATTTISTAGTSAATSITSTSTSTATVVTTTSTAIDIDMIMSAIYNRIYEDLYDEIRAEVIADLSEERFDQIYQQVVADVLDKVESGDITVTAASVIEMIYAIANEQANAVIGITALDGSGNQIAIGSGVLYHQVGDLYYVVTNNHVVENATSFEVVFADGTSIPAILRGVDATVDIAVLYFTSAEPLQTVTFADSEALTKGSIVLAVGNPNGYDYYGSMTMGIVSGINRYFDIDGDQVKDMFVNYIQHDASINAGNSGGALFNLDGEVVGINVIKIAATEIEGMGFAIPSNLVAAICADIEEYGVSKQKPVLGITFVDIASNPDYFTYYGITLPAGIENGFYVIAVMPGATLGSIVQIGDIVVSINGVDIVDTTQFIQFFSQYHVGDIIDVTVYRSGQYQTFEDIELLPKVN